jgi:translation initiation factor 3 subunit F
MSLPVVASSPALLLDEPMMTTQMNSTSGGGSNSSEAMEVIVCPVVLLHILDHHSRRQEDRVIGTLLGRRDGNRLVEITNAFSVPHAESGDEVAIGKDYNRKMSLLHLRTSPKEFVVGWYASTAADDGSGGGADAMVAETTSSLIHEFYATECDEGDPVHLVVDTRMISDCLQIRAYRNAPVILQSEHVGNLFHELKLSISASEPETICLNAMIKASPVVKGSVLDDSEEAKSDGGDAATAKVDDLQASMEKLYRLLDGTLAYVDDVVDGRVPENPEKGRVIADALAVIPRVRPAVLDRLFHNSLQDLLMVTYLSNITRAQLDVADKLNASLGRA